MKKETPLTGGQLRESIVFLACLLLFFYLPARTMGLANMLGSIMNTAFDLLINTCFYLMAICVLTGALGRLLSEFGVVDLINRLLSPLLGPVYGLPGAASLGIVTTFLSDNPAILTLAHDGRFRRLFRCYQLPALTNLGTSFGMGLIVCTYMVGLQSTVGVPLGRAVLVGVLGAVIGSILSTRLMLHFTKKLYGTEAMAGAGADAAQEEGGPSKHAGGAASRFIDAMLEGGKTGVDMGLSIIPGVVIICTLVMMLTYGPSASGGYTGAAYEGVALLPAVAERLRFLLEPLFGLSTPEAISVPVTALGAAGAAVSVVGKLAAAGAVTANDIAVFTAMCMCWSGYLSTHVSMMNSLGCNSLVGKALLSHTLGGLLAGMCAHWIYALLSLL